MTELGANFLDRIQMAASELSRVDEDHSLLEARPGGWLRKQELGHLLDSAQNNHQRIVMAAISGRFEGPGYEADPWVTQHGYEAFRWADLGSFWLARNRMLAHLVGRLTDEQLAAEVRVGDGEAVTLKALIEDYLAHLEHHVKQIVAELPPEELDEIPQSED